jgi:hypothetical protein
MKNAVLDLSLQIGGLLGAVALLILCSALGVPPSWALGLFALHVTGDLLDDPGDPDVLAVRIAGIATAALFLTLHYVHGIPSGWMWFGLGIHVTGDAIYIRRNSPMAFDINEYVNLYPFLGWIGGGIALLSLVLSSAGLVAKGIGTAGLLIAATGVYASYKIYKDGKDAGAQG